jgi:hypothetical protein
MIRLHGRGAELTTFVGRGHVSRAELLETYSSFLLRTPTRLVLWDLTRAKLTADGDDHGIWELAVMAALLARGRRTAGRTAIVCSSPEDLGLARTILARLRIVGYPVLVKEFADVEAAMSWLREEPGEQGSAPRTPATR